MQQEITVSLKKKALRYYVAMSKTAHHDDLLSVLEQSGCPMPRLETPGCEKGLADNFSIVEILIRNIKYLHIVIGFHEKRTGPNFKSAPEDADTYEKIGAGVYVP